LYGFVQGSLYGIREKLVAALQETMPDRTFRELAQELEETASKFKATKDPAVRREILAYMRVLIGEADRIMSQRSPVSN